MKQLFLSLTEKLEENKSLKWVDEDKGQMNFERPPVLFPAALVELQIPKTESLSRYMQNHNVSVTVRLAFDFTGNTNTKTPHAERVKSLAFYTVIEEVRSTLQGWEGESFNDLQFQGLYSEKRPDQYKVVTLSFSTSYRCTNES